MKKKLLFIASIALLLFTACEKDTDQLSFSAVMENPSHNGKTTLTSNGSGSYYNLAWESGDQIVVTDGSLWADLNFIRVNGDKATFNGECPGFNLDASSYEAYYPSSLRESNSFVLPSTQVYRSNGLTGFPMYAKTNTNTGVLKFQNLCGALKFEVPATTGVTITKIVVEANEPLCGTFELQGETDSKQAYITSGTNTITLDCGTGVTLSSNTNFFVTLPAGTYSNLKVKFFDDAAGYYEKTASANTTIERNHIYSIPTTLGTRHELPAMLDVSKLRALLTGVENIYFEYNSEETTGTQINVDGYVKIYANKESETLTISTLASSISLPAGDMDELFKDCTILESINFGEGFDVSNQTSMVSVFDGCTNLAYAFLSSFATSQVTDMSNFFKDCVNLTEVVLGNDFIINNGCNVTNFFYNAASETGFLSIFCLESTYNKLCNDEDFYLYFGTIDDYEE